VKEVRDGKGKREKEGKVKGIDERGGC